MQYLPCYYENTYIWCRFDPDPPDYEPFLWGDRHWLPPELFDRLRAGLYEPSTVTYLANRAYTTAAEALADLQQAAQTLYEQKHQPTQYRNPF